MYKFTNYRNFSFATRTHLIYTLEADRHIILKNVKGHRGLSKLLKIQEIAILESLDTNFRLHGFLGFSFFLLFEIFQRILQRCLKNQFCS